jgi:hypothetical protein
MNFSEGNIGRSRLILKVKLKPTITTQTPIPLQSTNLSVKTETPKHEDPNSDFTNEEIYAMKLEHFSTNMDKLVDSLGIKLILRMPIIRS